MTSLTTAQRIEILDIYRTNSARETADIFNSRYPHRVPALTHSAVVKLQKKFLATGSVVNQQKTGRPSKVHDEDVALHVIATVELDQKIATRKLSREVDLCRSTVSKILKEEKYRPYKSRFLNKHYGTDSEQRLQFCQKFMQRVQENNLFTNNILWSDESVFKISGSFNRQNNRYYFSV